MTARKPNSTEPEQEPEEQATVEEPEPTLEPEPEPGVMAQRKALREQGYKRCPTHERYLNRLPEAVREPVAGFNDPAIRPLSEFNRHIAACRACISVRSKDRRMAAKQTTAEEPTDGQQE